MSTAPGENTEIDPDSDPGNLTEKAPRQPDQAEGEDDAAETGDA
jgi:hypothetical protein